MKGTLIRYVFSFILSAALPCVCRADDAVRYPTIKPCGFIQGWAWYDKTAGAIHGEDFEIARARFGIKGNFSANTDYLLLTEWGRLTYDDPATLVDAWVNLKVNPALNIKIGQTWYKFSLSGSEAIPNIPFIYRPEVVDGIWLPMGRTGAYGYDRGIELWGDFKNSILPLGYVFSVTTGAGLDHFEDNGKKDFVGRLYIEPKKDLKLGMSGFYGYSRVSVVSNLLREEKVDLPEYAGGVDVSYKQKHFRVIYEYLEGLYEGYLDANAQETFQVATKRPRGWYGMFGFKPLSWIEIPVQYAWYEKDAVKSDTGLESITVGVTWFLKEGTLNNVKFNYIIRSAEPNYGSKPRNMLALQLQLVF